MLKKIISVQSIFRLLVVACLILTVFCIQTKKKDDYLKRTSALHRIKKSGTIRLITDLDLNVFNIYHDWPRDFEHELALEFSSFIGARLEMVTLKNSNILTDFYKKRGEFISSSLTLANQDKISVARSEPFLNVQQRLIHHKLILPLKSIKELAGRAIHIRKDSPYHLRLKAIKSLGIDIKIITYDVISTEELIRRVALRQIKYTVANNNIAMLNRRYYPDIHIGLPIKEKEQLRWLIRGRDFELLEKMNAFIEMIKSDGTHRRIFQNYYGNIDDFDYFDLKLFHKRIKTRLPEYKDMIVSESKKYQFDWRMIASVVYQESHFDPLAESHTGVKGIMQVTHETAVEMGIQDRMDPLQSVKAGIKYLDKLYKRFDDIKDRHQRFIFALASYNIGYGHIRDAQKITKELGMNKNRWSSLKQTLPLLTRKKYYKKTRYGYARGKEPVRYVDKILTYYNILKHQASMPSQNWIGEVPMMFY